MRFEDHEIMNRICRLAKYDKGVDNSERKKINELFKSLPGGI